MGVGRVVIVKESDAPEWTGRVVEVCGDNRKVRKSGTDREIWVSKSNCRPA